MSPCRISCFATSCGSSGGVAAGSVGSIATPIGMSTDEGCTVEMLMVL